MKLLPIVLFIAALLAGCTTADKLNQLRIGMTKAEAVAIMGQPDSKSAQGTIEYYTYYLQSETRDQPYLVRFVNDRVESFGRFAQLFDIYNRPVNGQPSPTLGPGSVGMTSAYPVSATARDGIAEQLQKLKALKDQGVLTDEEFQRAKNRVIDGQR